MRFSEFLQDTHNNNELESVVANALQTLKGDANDQDQTSEVSFDALKQIISNTGHPNFNYDLFKKLYDGGNVLKNIVDNFDNEKITLKTDKQSEKDPEITKDKTGSTDVVKKMAQRALKKRS